MNQVVARAGDVREGEVVFHAGEWRTVTMTESNPDVPGNTLLHFDGRTFECKDSTPVFVERSYLP